MRIWAIANQKGGVGKTTTAVTLGGLLAQRGHKVLLVDMDPHGSMTAYFKHDPDELEQSAFDLFQDSSRMDSGRLKRLLVDTGLEDVDLLPASSSMATLDRQFGAKGGMGLILKQALGSVREVYDYALIDCPPVLGILMVNALAACERLLIPVQTEFLALKGLERIVNTLNMIARAQKFPLEYTVVPTLYDKRTKASRVALQALQEKYPDHLWRGVIPVDTQFREASTRALPLSMLAPKSRGVLAYAQLLDSLDQKIEFDENRAAM